MGIIEDLCACAETVSPTCGLHVHLGRPAKIKEGENPPFGVKSEWSPQHTRTWLSICAMLEEKLFKLVPESRKNSRHCRQITKIFDDNAMSAFYPIGSTVARKYENPQRYCWLNLIETRRRGTSSGGASGPATGTVEVRMLGNTRRFTYIWHWVQLWVKIAALIAYVPPELAISHCVLSSTLKTDMEGLLAIKEGRKEFGKDGATEKPSKKPAKPAEPVEVSNVNDGEVITQPMRSDPLNLLLDNA